MTTSQDSKLGTVIVCVDGSDLSTRAGLEGLALLRPVERLLVVTVVEAADPTLVAGSGMAGGVMSPEQYAELDEVRTAEGDAHVADAVRAFGVPGAETRVLRGDAASVLCTLAAQESARALVLGSRGRGGIKRALLGSVSDYVVRNAPCPVIITGDAAS
jgi:nucleotide-binding universal stress UspA family protein